MTTKRAARRIPPTATPPEGIWVQVAEADFGFSIELPKDLADRMERGGPDARYLFLAYFHARINRMVLDDHEGRMLQDMGVISDEDSSG